MIRRVLNQLAGDGLRARALRGTALTLSSVGGGHVVRLISNLILTRLLFPEAFGLMALVTVFMTGLAMFSDVGLRASIIQNKRGDDPDFLNTAWTMQIGRGVALFLVTLALALPMASFYGEPMLAQLLPVAGIGALIQGFNSTRMVTANKHLVLGRLTAMSLGSQFLSTVVMILLAWLYQSVWALVIGGLAGNLSTMILSHTALPGLRNRPRFERAAARELFGFGKFVFLSTAAAFVINQGDRAVLGKFVPLGELALYNIGFFLANVPVLLGRSLSGSILFPLYASRPPGESEQNRRNIFRARRLVTGFLMSGAAVMALAGDWLVILMYDPRYEGAGPLLVLISIGAMPTMILQSYGSLLLSTGRSGRFSILVITRAIVMLALLVLAAKLFGAGGVALAPALAELICYPLMIYLIRPTKGWDPVHDMLYAAAAAALATIAVWINMDAIVQLF